MEKHKKLLIGNLTFGGLAVIWSTYGLITHTYSNLVWILIGIQLVFLLIQWLTIFKERRKL
jgi:hypothetical protein